MDFYGVDNVGVQSHNAYVFKCTYNSGDYYTGLVYASSSEDYTLGLSCSGSNLQGETSTYEIIGVKPGKGSPEQDGLVYIEAYHDAESGRDYVPLGAEAPLSTAYLGSEHGFIIQADVPEYFFSSAESADLVSYAYDFTFAYTTGGDSYAGTVYAEPEKGYSTSYTKTATDENNQTGTYTISTVTPGYDGSLAGQVFVSSYYDKESGKTFTPVGSDAALGADYLGSEEGYIIKGGVQEYLFGAVTDYIYEADLVMGNKNTFTFHYGNGDSYTGAVYADPTTYRYYLGYTEAKTDELGRVGYYEITGVESGTFKAKPGEVYLNGYYDVESNQTFTPMSKGKKKVGTSYLGSEVDYIFKKNVDYLKFGGGYWEADQAGLYGFTYYFGNGDGDYYRGSVYAVPDRYQVKQQIPVLLDENGDAGYYQITGVNYLGATTKAGQVLTASYYDLESNQTYTPMSKGRSAVGKSYLGSEVDYIIKKNVEKNRFGLYKGVFYEADK